jgi:hypothetical protein
LKKIEIIVLPDGQTKVETKGFSGSECQRASEFLEKALGQRMSEQLTAEFYGKVTEQENVREGQ